MAARSSLGAAHIDERDEPFDGMIPPEPPFAEYLAYLGARHVPTRYLPQFEAEARALCARFRDRPPSLLDRRALAIHFEEGRRASLSDRALRNRRVGSEAFLEFLRDPSVWSLSSSVSSIAPPPVNDPSERRRHPRVPFLTEVEVTDIGAFRCADISIGGMYLENLTTVVRGAVIQARFRLQNTDADPIAVTAQVTFVHPQFGTGIEFVSISAEAVARISRLVAQLSAPSQNE